MGKRGNSLLSTELSPPVILSSDKDDWPDYRTIWGKLSELERERVQKSVADSGRAVRRSRRESKVQKMVAFKRTGDLILSRIAILEGECSSPSGSSSEGGTPMMQQEVWVTEQQHS